MEGLVNSAFTSCTDSPISKTIQIHLLNKHRGTEVAGRVFPSHFFRSRKTFSQTCEMSLFLINIPIAKDNRHLIFGRFVKLEQPKTGSMLRVFQNVQFILQHFFKYFTWSGSFQLDRLMNISLLLKGARL